MLCPNDNQIAEYVERLLPAVRAASIQQHISSCQACRTLADVLSSQPMEFDSSLLEPPSEKTSIGRFEIRRILGLGAMGIVYLAHDPELDREVAIKVLSNNSQLTFVDSQRLRREGQSLARLSHSNVVSVFEAGVDSGRGYVVMERLGGDTLDAWLEDHQPDIAAILAVFRQAGAGLVAAHGAGLVHRDFKPSNVMIDEEGGAVVTDFGLVQIDNSGDPQGDISDVDVLKLSASGAVLGTPAYMAPEQLFGGAASEKSDQFAYCVTLYEALCGDRPFAGTTLYALRANIAASHQTGPDMNPLPLSLSPRMRRAIAKGLSVDPEQRHLDMHSLLRELAAPEPNRTRSTVWAGVAVLLMGGVALGFLLFGAGTVEETCANAGRHFQGIWDSESKPLVHAGLGTSDVAYAEDTWARLETRMDGFSQLWTSSYETVCRATERGEQSTDLLDRKMLCLQRQISATKRLVEIWQRSDPNTVASVQRALLELGDPRDCTLSGEFLHLVPMPSDSQTRAEIVSLEQEIAANQAQLHTGEWEAAARAGEELLRQATATGYRPVQALACAMQVDASMLLSRPVVEELEACVRIALAAGEDRLQTVLLIQLLGEYSEKMRSESYEEVRKRVVALLERLQQPRGLRSSFLEAEARHLFAQRNYRDAIAAIGLILQEIEDVQEYWAAEQRFLLLSLRAHAHLAELAIDEAIQDSNTALTVVRQVYGEKHPWYAQEMHNMRLYYEKLESGPEKRELLANWALAMEGIVARTDVFALQVQLLAAETVEEELQTAESMVRAAKEYFGPSHPEVAVSMRFHAVALNKAERYGAAETVVKAALAMREEYFGFDDDQHHVLLSDLFDALVGQERLADAEAVARASISRVSLLADQSKVPYVHLMAQMMLVEVLLSRETWQDLLDALPLLRQLLAPFATELKLSIVDANFVEAVAHLGLGHKVSEWLPQAEVALETMTNSEDEEITPEFLSGRNTLLARWRNP